MTVSRTGYSEPEIFCHSRTHFREDCATEEQLRDCLDRLHQYGSFIERIDGNDGVGPLWVVKCMWYIYQNLDGKLVPFHDNLLSPISAEDLEIPASASDSDSDPSRGNQNMETGRMKPPKGLQKIQVIPSRRKSRNGSVLLKLSCDQIVRTLGTK